MPGTDGNDAERFTITMSLPNRMFLTKPLREFMALTLAAEGFDEEEVEEIGLVATELVNNSFEHASSRETHHVEIGMTVTGDRWIFRIRDEGEGGLTQADFEQDLDCPPDHLGDRGRGLFLVTCFTDDVVVRPAEGGGTEVEITKMRKGRSP